MKRFEHDAAWPGLNVWAPGASTDTFWHLPNSHNGTPRQQMVQDSMKHDEVAPRKGDRMAARLFR
ncbi:hypothetical protein CMQ_6533 [Grosmannia clavigera kw1407]|uniref:Uncharacterized protein n=1 Tax=Grosmannia clavigera (strain kw1407 / UAMH 11150) TaxID=655863 RepID=F0X7F2_GROCL|nr:uncharacterized protein CMQ_6533 [Grosmannia clavigera kw1407]EFX06212.1 hypothetical protein CMQ_6533 [Grosmannia clavigera kw1407]